MKSVSACGNSHFARLMAYGYSFCAAGDAAPNFEDGTRDVPRLRVALNHPMMTHIEDRPRSLRDPAAVGYRRTLLREPHMEVLTTYTDTLRRRGRGEVPEFDPFDGGIDAQILFLFEKPGPMTNGQTGSGLISRNNDDPTAEATFCFMQIAGIARKLTVTWNVIPWWNGTRRITGAELEEGVACVNELIALLPRLRSVVLVGRKAARAARLLDGGNLAVFTSAHPSPLVRARYPERWREIPRQWAGAFRSDLGEAHYVR